MNSSDISLYSDTGFIKFANGEIIAIEIREYSSDNKTNWERTYFPFEHQNTLSGIGTLPGHKYTRVKHTGDVNFQVGYRLDPKEPVFRVNEDNLLEWKYLEESDTNEITQTSNWRLLLDLEVLRGQDGDQGPQGIQGEGLYRDAVGYYKLRPDCCSSLITSSTSCKTCNTGSSSSEMDRGYYFQSIGDGLITITTEIVAAGLVTVDAVNYTHQSNDLIIWTPITSTVVDLDVRYLATDGIGTGAIDMRTKDYYGTRGHVYVCADGKWTDLPGIVQPTYQVKETAGSNNIGFLDHFVTPAQVGLDNSITIENGDLKVAVERIDETAFIQTTFGDGIEIENPQDKPQIKVSDVDGFGLRSYESTTDSKDDLQVYVQDFISNGLTFENVDTIDGEQRDLIRVNLNDLIDSPNATNTTYTGLTNSTAEGYNEEDTYDNIYVKPGDAIGIDENGVNILADELTLTAENLEKIKVLETDSLTLGIQALHVHKNLVDETKGLQKANDTTGQFEIKPDSTYSSIGFNGINGDLWVMPEGIHGLHINSDVVDTTKGLYVNTANDKIETKVDSTNDSIVYINGGELAVNPAYILTVMEDSSVTRLNNNGVSLYGDIDFETTNSDTTGIFDLVTTFTHSGASNDLANIDLTVDEAAFEAQIKTWINNDYLEGKLETILIAGTGIVLTPDSINNTITINSDVFDGTIPTAGSDVAPLTSLNLIEGVSDNYARADHKHSIPNIGIFHVDNDNNDRTLSVSLDSKIELDTWYDNMMISNTGGLHLKSTGGVVWRIVIDDQGNMDTVKVV